MEMNNFKSPQIAELAGGVGAKVHDHIDEEAAANAESASSKGEDGNEFAARLSKKCKCCRRFISVG